MPTIRQQRPGRELARLRKAAGLTPRTVQTETAITESALSRIENGVTTNPRPATLRLLFTLYKATEEEQRTVLQLYEAAQQPDPWQAFADVLRDWFRNYLDLEATTTGIRKFEPLLVPGLFQTEDYARAILKAGGTSGNDLERQIQLRMTRQEILTRDEPPHLWTVIDEAVLRRPVGGPEVMRAQLDKLQEATQLPNVTLRVLPFEVGAHAAMLGAYLILHFESNTDVAYTENVGGAVYHEAQTEVHAYREAFEQQWSAASPAETLIANAIKDL